MIFPKTPSFSLKNKRALVTGAGRGIGMGAAIALSSAGAEVLMVSRTTRELEIIDNYLRGLGHKCSYKSLDVTDEKAVSKLIKNEDCFDILVNNAGTNIPSSLVETKIEDFDYVMSLNVKSVINLTKNVVKKMLENNILGSIINVSSQMGHVGGPNRTTYCSTKFALEGFTKSLAIELAPNGIRVNSICPTFIKTPMTEPFLKDKDFKNQVLSMIPLGRLGEVEDLMGPFVFLASEASSMMTGSSVLVDGGWTSR